MKKVVRLLVCLLLIVMFAFPALADDDIITYEELKQYGQIYDCDGNKGLTPVKIEAVIGKVKKEEEGYFPNTYFDLWIKGENGYGYDSEEISGVSLSMTNFPHEIASGQRVVYELTPYSDGSFMGSNISNYEIIEEDVDYKEIEKQYKESYEAVSYKKLMRNIDDYKGKRICAEGSYIQEIESEYSYITGLMMDDNLDVYSFIFSSDRVEFKLLLNDRIKIYGHLASKEPTYKYLSFTGNKEVPYIWVDFIDLLEDE